MEEMLQITADVEQNGDDTVHNLNNSSSLSVDRKPLAELGNEENVHENFVNIQKRSLPRFGLFKKMRLGRSPQKPEEGIRHGSAGKAFLIKSSESKSHNLRPSIADKAVDIGKRMLFDPATDMTAFGSEATIIKENEAATINNKDEAISIPPPLENTLSCESSMDASSSISEISHNYLDGFGKQNKGKNIGDRGARTCIESQSPNLVPKKDPRFHHKRQPKPQSHNWSNANKSYPRTQSFPADPLSVEGSQIFLAPVIVPPSSLQIGSRSSPKINVKEWPSSSPLPPQKRSSVFETSHAAIAAAQEAPELPATSSQETISSETSSVAMSALTASTTSSLASTLVKRLVGASMTKDNPKVRPQRQTVRSTPVRIKPRVRPQEVQATDQGYASVAKLSAWLADDPTSSKKVRHLRRGANVLAKSRKFEKDLENVVVEETNISSGVVKEKKDWLKSVFSQHKSEEGELEDEFFEHDPNRHLMSMRTRPVNFDDDCTRSEFVVNDDSLSSISVTNKKKWLENAFKKEDDSTPVQKRFPSKAQSDIGPLRESRDDVTARAKKMWQQKAEMRATGGHPGALRPPAPPSTYRSSQRPQTSEEKMPASLSSRPSAPSTQENLSSRHSVSGVAVEKDTTPVDFRAARELLIQRSKDNGNEVRLASKVQKKAKKFEKISKERKRRSSATGLLKPTWEPNSEVGHAEPRGPSNAYTKAFVEDIAPKKSFEELP